MHSYTAGNEGTATYHTSYDDDQPQDDGWVLYYSPEGYPYYYNQYTGESQWAEYDENEQNNQQDPDEELDRNDYKSSTQNYSDDESVDTEEYEEEEFQEYLHSEAGKRAYEEEKRRLEEYFNSKNMIHENYSEEVDEEEEEEEEPEVYHESPRYTESTMNRREEYYRNNDAYTTSMNQRPYPSQQMSSQEVSQFISTYGLPPPPNKYSPRRARLPGMPSDSYNAIGSIMSTPRGMKIGRRHESIGPDIEGGDFDDINEPDAPQKLQSIPESSATTKKAKKSKKKLDINPDDETDPDLQIIKQPIVPVWLSTILQEMYNQLLRIPAIYVLQSLASSSLSNISNPVTPVTVNDTLQLSDVILTESPQEASGGSSTTMSESILDYLNGVARYVVEGNAKPSPPKDDQQQQQQESHPP